MALTGKAGIHRGMVPLIRGVVAAWDMERNLPPEEQVVLNPVLLAKTAGIDPDPWQGEFLQSDAKRVLLNCARQSGKSTMAAVLAVHGALYERRSLTLLLSPGLRQSQEIFAKCRDIYSAIGKPVTAESESALQMRLQNGSRIVSLPGNAGRIRGFSGARRIIIDEAAWVPDDLYQSVRPMLAVSGGDLIAMSTPWGKRGWWYEAWASTTQVWERYMVTAEQCPRISPEFLADERLGMPETWYLQEYMCVFSDLAGQLFPTDLILGAFTPELDVLFPDRLQSLQGPTAAQVVTDDVRPMFDVMPMNGSLRNGV